MLPYLIVLYEFIYFYETNAINVRNIELIFIIQEKKSQF
jgi:hypothetical protein